MRTGEGLSFLERMREDYPFLRYVLPPVDWPRRMHDIWFQHISIYGPPSSGKTTAALTLASMAELYCQTLGINFTCYRALTLRDMLTHMMKHPPPNRGLLFLIVDDAEAANPSRRATRTWEHVANHDLIRHLLRLRGFKVGGVVVCYCTQRFRNLDVVLRNSFLAIFKGIASNDPYEEKFFRDMLGSDWYTQLVELTLKIYESWSPEYLRHFIGRLMGGEVFSGILPPPRRPEKLVDLWRPEAIAAYVGDESYVREIVGEKYVEMLMECDEEEPRKRGRKTGNAYALLKALVESRNVWNKEELMGEAIKAGISYSTFCRTLKRLESEGVVKVRGSLVYNVLAFIDNSKDNSNQ